jgi:hypothetical protein
LKNSYGYDLVFENGNIADCRVYGGNGKDVTYCASTETVGWPTKTIISIGNAVKKVFNVVSDFGQWLKFFFRLISR